VAEAERIIGQMMKPLHLLFFSALLWAIGCVGRPPHAILPPIAEEYGSGEKGGILQGGIV